MLRLSSTIFLTAIFLILTACRADAASGELAVSPTATARPPAVSPTVIAQPTATPPPAIAPTPTPRPVVFPDDERSHENLIEWWYYNGHLKASNDDLFGFHYVIFKAKPPGWPPLLASQLGVTNLTESDHVEGEAVLLSEKASSNDHVLLSGGDWELRINEDGHFLKGAVGETSIALELAPQRPPTLHNDIGWLSDQSGGWTYYYSWTRMSATGTIQVNESISEVDGSAWMDHQWGDFTVATHPAGWQWFAIQYDDGSDLMLTASRDENLEPVALYGTFVHPDGTTVALTEDGHGIVFEETDMWTSPHNDGEYPAGWRITIDALDLEFAMKALVADQEIASARFIPIKYWEGKVSVSGTRNGHAVGGDAYAELTGYTPN